jgi:hypothetical protein
VPQEYSPPILDDTTLDKPYARNIELVHWYWSGKHHRVVAGISLLTSFIE